MYSFATISEIFLETIVRVGLVVVALVLMVSASGAAQRGVGSICIAARVDAPFFKEPAILPNGKVNSHGLKFRVDKRPIEEWPQRKSAKIAGLDTTERHLLVVLDSHGKPIESIRT